MKRFTPLLLLFFIFQISSTMGQENVTTDTLENIVISAYESNQKLIDVPAPVSIVGKRELSRYDNATVLQAINTKPGIRMDERSPGSYRINIRGSSLRSPFGISNVKVYYDGIPYTGPGGTTDLNMLGFYSYNSIEIIKGPAGSMYGAGTGGAILIKNNPELFRPGFTVGYTGGSYNMNNAGGSFRFGNEEANNTITYQHLNNDGYRDHTKMRRDIISWDGMMKKTDRTILQSHFFYSDIYYQTPGGLTKAEYDANPRAARPKAGIFPSAEESRAEIHDQNFLAGFSLNQKIGSKWENKSVVYGYYWRHNNPTFRNYTRRVEPNFGARTDFSFNQNINNSKLTLNLGAEFQQNFITSRLYDNNGGVTGAVQTDDEINNTLGFVFGQANLEIPEGWIFTAGLSLNKAKVVFERFSTVPPENEKRNFKTELAPRVAILKKINNDFSVYATVERGFSSPTSAELLPTSGEFSRSLQAESGTNYEVGVKGSFVDNRLFLDISAFHYKLKNAIVQRQDAGGGLFYDNAGSTNQNGLETYISYTFLRNTGQFFENALAYLSSTMNNFKYDDYKQVNNDFSGNKVIGVASQTLAAGIDVATQPGVYGHLTYFHSGKIPLDNANTAFADAYNLLGLKIGYRVPLSGSLGLDIFGGIQNILDETYSLGNDINAAGGRYYNVAAGRNYYAGVVLNFDKK